MDKLYVSLQLYCWPILWGYLWPHISFHGNAQGSPKCPLNFSFCKLSEFVRKFPKLFNFSDGKEKSYLVHVELNIFKENACYGLQIILLHNFSQNFYIWSAIVNGTCMQKIKIGHLAKFWAKSKCFPQILFPVRTILRSIQLLVSLFWFIQLTRVSWCRLRAHVQQETLSSLLKTLQNVVQILRTLLHSLLKRNLSFFLH